MKQKYIYGAIIRKDEEDGGYWAEVPDLPGCFGSGDTFEDAVVSISDGVETHVAALIELGMDVPESAKVKADDGEVVYVYANIATTELSEPSVTASEAAKRLGVTPGRVSQLISAGKLKASRAGSTTFVTERSIDEYAASPRKAGRPQKVPVTV